MPSCLKCGSKVEDTDTFCQNCGTPLKDLAASPATSTAPSLQVKAEENENLKKPNDPKKEKTQEKPDRSFVYYLALGLILITVGVSAILELTDGKLAMSALLAVMLFTIGLIVILAAVYAAFAGRKHTPSKPSDATSEKPTVQPSPQESKK